MKQLNKNGFTIIELMIATIVFSVILLVISTALIQIGRLYTKGTTAARTQEVARTTMNDITQAIQFGSGAIEETSDPLVGKPFQNISLCEAGRQYNYVLGQQVNGLRHGLVAYDPPSGDCSSTVIGQDMKGDGSGVINGVELLGDNMRLSTFSVQKLDDDRAYKITVGVVYGDDDLLCTTEVDNCSSDSRTLTESELATGDLRCKNVRTGTQFCSASELSTTVERRVP